MSDWIAKAKEIALGVLGFRGTCASGETVCPFCARVWGGTGGREENHVEGCIVLRARALLAEEPQGMWLARVGVLDAQEHGRQYIIRRGSVWYHAAWFAPLRCWMSADDRDIQTSDPQVTAIYGPLPEVKP